MTTIITNPLAPFCRCIGTNYLDRSQQFFGADIFFAVEFQNDRQAIAEGIAPDLLLTQPLLDLYYDQIQLEQLTVGSGLTIIRAEPNSLLLTTLIPTSTFIGLTLPAIIPYCFTLINPNASLIDTSYRGTFTVKQPWQ